MKHILFLAIWFMLAATNSVLAAEKAGAVYYNGNILTMNDEQPAAEAVAVKDGKILAVGSEKDVLKAAGEEAKKIDLGGKNMLPGFIDSHSHLIQTAVKLATVNLDPPPAGDVTSIEMLKARMRERLAQRPKDSKGWLVGWGYDHGMLDEGRHPTRDDLDEISTEVPVLVLHFSSLHKIVVNSKALELAGVTAESEDPEGGVIHRRPGSKEPNGILDERAALPVAMKLAADTGLMPADSCSAPPQSTNAKGDVIPKLVERALEEYASAGYTTVTESAATFGQAKLLRKMAAAGKVPIDVIVLILSLEPDEKHVARIAELYSPDYDKRVRVAGSKIVLDGGTPGRTAYLRDPYHVQLPGETDFRGFPAFPNQADVDALVGLHYTKGVPVFIHALGDASMDQCIAAVRKAEKGHPGSDRRTQLIHLQQVQEDQFEALEKLDVSLTFQVTHNFYFADFHAKEILGPERTARLNPAASALKHGLSVTIHHDAPIHPVDQFMLIWNAVERKSRSGKVWGEDQRISVMDALKASTINAAYQYHEEETKGSIEVGKLADLVIIDRNPLEIAPAELRELKVLETIKEGRTVYKAK